ncbi:MAG: single-stranded-DNA-specific exonuclease RecJ [Clostridium sp.]|nr:single-stranded-DNA-specific exonuclease RecJ [Acetatifactor muris]MCM1527259.1 single-stranded-DNA-specific exonuclease RecJ [Bacteroides sp.]MCM1563047.1 single-stranded-DNA-specific exonuclease RecJ [Clostridium sp.]
MEKWMVAARKADFAKWARDFGISPVVARILRNRGLTEETQVEKFLRGTLADCHSPWLLKDMDRAVERVWRAVEREEKIRVIGDYDVDGICSAHILTKGLRLAGGLADTAIPHRIHDGYGLNDRLIEAAGEDGIRLIVTCDNGIAAAEQIALANTLGIDVVVTDHHEVPYVTDRAGGRREILPEAVAVVDPKRSDCPYPFKGICGGVVAYKFMQAFLEDGERVTAYAPDATAVRESMEEFLEFAAFATVCDVMELADENRILVKEGLKRLQNSRNRGLRALIRVNGLEAGKLSAYHLGFVLGPCLNATGRLDTAKRALELLQSDSDTEAMSAARELVEMNDSRKNLTSQGVEAAEQYIVRHHMENDKVLVIYLPEVHESLAGIIAGRVRERHDRPVFVLTKGEEGVKGSGRSIEAWHMYDGMTQVKELFTKYGGHKMAAGLSMAEENVERLRRELNERCELTEEDFAPVVHIDVPMPLSYASEDLARELEILEPFGVGNPQPLFAQKNLVFLSAAKMGAGGNSAGFRVRTPEGTVERLVLFRNLEGFEEFLADKYGPESVGRLYAGQGSYEISVVYKLGLNTYRGRTEKQFVMQYFC